MRRAVRFFLRVHFLRAGKRGAQSQSRSKTLRRVAAASALVNCSQNGVRRQTHNRYLGEIASWVFFLYNVFGMTNYYFDKLRSAVRSPVGVFIDAANLEKSVQAMWVHPRDVPDRFRGTLPEMLTWRIDYKKLARFFRSIAPLAILNFYTADFGTESHARFLSLLVHLGYKIRKKPLKIYADHTDDHPHRKANFDVEISVDAVTRAAVFETMILFSGDCDFAYLLDFVRASGKRTILFSRKGHVAKELFPATDGYFDIIDFRHDFLRIVPNKSQKSP